MELADTIPSPSLTHLFHFYPLIQVGIVLLHTGKRCYTVIATHSVNMVLENSCIRIICDVVAFTQLFISSVKIIRKCGISTFL